MRRVALIGAGNIAQAHAEALRGLSGVRISAVVDPAAALAERLAQACGGAATYASAEAALAAEAFDAAHVLVPPDLHAPIARPIVAAGKAVLLEKPLAVSSAECAELAAAAAASGAALGVNQNFLFHPAFTALRARLERGEIGRASFVDCLYNVPLRQLAARQFGHWMFDRPVNILLEQAVHPLSQIAALAGEIREVAALAEPALPLAPGLSLRPSLTATLGCARLPATLRFAVGQEFPFWQITVIGDDGVLVADMLANRCYRHARTRYLGAADNALSSAATGLSLAGAGVRNMADYALSMVKLKGRSDPFFLSMKGSIAAFHASLDGGRRFEADAAFGASLVSVCERLAEATFGAAEPRPARPPAPETWDIAVLGGTGFIGAETVRVLVEAGYRVSVLARTMRNLPAIFDHASVALIRGDVKREEDVARAIGPARIVVNLAHGGGGATYEAVRAAMVDSATMVARLSLARGVERLIHVGSIASLYLGPQDTAVTGATPPDKMAEQRGDYARAKAEADRALLAMHASQKLPLVILRPGLVVGAGTPPFHSGLGFFNNEQHVIGWNRGDNPLPFVLVHDVAEAILGAIRAPGIEGRCYNLVGDVRLSAREFVAELARATGRPLRFHPQRPTQLWLEDIGKWVVKRAGGRRAPMPPKRDFLSRGLAARIDCADAKRDLGWQPVSDRAVFIREAVDVHGR